MKNRPSRHQAPSTSSHGDYEVIIRAQLDWHMKKNELVEDRCVCNLHYCDP